MFGDTLVTIHVEPENKAKYTLRGCAVWDSLRQPYSHVLLKCGNDALGTNMMHVTIKHGKKDTLA